MAGAPATDDPHILPFPAGDGGNENDGGELSFGDGEDLETAYRRALAAVDAAGPVLAPPPAGAPAAAPGEPADGEEEESGEPAEPTPAAAGPRVSPREVIEAALFVGGAGLTARRAGTLLRGTFTDADLAAAVAELNRRYEADGRPYRAAAGADGYELRLRPEYEPLRRRLYGLGPREVTLPPDVLETLSVVAYRQPVTAAAVETARDKPSGATLRRLVRLGVLRLDKPDPADPATADGGGNAEPTFATTPRFLDLFGLGSLDELPVPADLRFK